MSYKYTKSRSVGFFTNDDVIYAYELVKKTTRQDLGDDIMRIIIDKGRRIDRQYLEKYGKKIILDRIASEVATIVLKDKHPSPVDMHELLKEHISATDEGTEVYSDYRLQDDGEPMINKPKEPVIPVTKVTNIDNLLGYHTPYNLRSVFNPDANIGNIYVFLDTRYRILDSDGSREFRWNFDLSDKTFQGSINAYGYIRDIVSIEISPFRIPKPSNLSVIHEILQYEKVTLRIKEFDTQATITHENWCFEFEFIVEDNGAYLRLKPLPNTAATYIFRKPITQLSTLTISFGTPINLLLFDKDRLELTMSAVAGVLTVTSIAGEFHNLTTLDLVYFTEFSTVNSAIPPVGDVPFITFMNRERGHQIINVTNTTFDIDYTSVSTINHTFNPVNKRIPCYFGSKRILFKIHFRYLRGLNENEE